MPSSPIEQVVAEYCRLPQDCQVATFPLDHIMPESQGGEPVPDNLALACPRCNSGKWAHSQAVDPESGVSVALFNPRIQIWTEHFRWSVVDPVLIEGLTACGRATIAQLGLNAAAHLQVRRWLMALDMHPPP